MKHQRQSGVALVITLLMLSVITFLAVAFLSLTRRDRASVGVSQSQTDSRLMADAALSRAQSEIVARMKGGRDLLNYDLTVSRNYIRKGGYTNAPAGVVDTNNVNYDHYEGSATPLNPADYVQNIANLYFDPRPPVFIRTNADPKVSDFRFWIDLNRNGRFETNGVAPVLDSAENFILDTNRTGSKWLTNIFVGEPEWIGVLRNPQYPHSATNPFMGRFAFVVQPIGKTLDLNFVHNYAKGNVNAPATMNSDGFLRNQGYGSWEINLGAWLRDIHPETYVTNAFAQYWYRPGTVNAGECFNDALAILKFRYDDSFNNLAVGPGLFLSDTIDSYSAHPSLTPVPDFSPATDPDSTNTSFAWSGSDNPNSFYDMQELFDRTKIQRVGVGQTFVDRLTNAVAGKSSEDRYTFSRILATMGTDSSPEFQVDVNADKIGTRRVTKVNLNYDNSWEISNRLNTCNTNFVNWTPLGFFTNAAEILLRSQYRFGVTNIPVYSSTNSGIRYLESVHRLLQLAANLYDATCITNGGTNRNLPSVFRPIFRQEIDGNITNVYIAGYLEVANRADVQQLMLAPFKRITDGDIAPANTISSNNVWGIPLVIGAKKGLPNFNQYSLANRFAITRKLEFIKTAGRQLPAQTNQMYVVGLTNMVGVELWNSYTGTFTTNVTILITNLITFNFTNESAVGYTGSFATNLAMQLGQNHASNWPAWKPGYNTGFVVPYFITNALLTSPLTNGVKGLAQWMEVQKRFETNSSVEIYERGLKFPQHDWFLNVTNFVRYALIDEGTGRILDYVNLGDFGTSTNCTGYLNTKYKDYRYNPWDTNGGSYAINSDPSQGVSNQIAFCLSSWPVDDKLYRSRSSGRYGPDDRDSFRKWWDKDNNDPNDLIRYAPYEAFGQFIYMVNWEANDPLVHYTIGDLTDPEGLNNPEEALDLGKIRIGKLNKRYNAWMGDFQGSEDRLTYRNLTLKDPKIAKSDDWDFPTNKFPSLGWLGRVHRGTPWQTVYLKSERPAKRGDDRGAWTNKWVTCWPKTYPFTDWRFAFFVDEPWNTNINKKINYRMANHPTYDWRLLDLFTVAPSENAARGLLSVNQTNLAAWSAVLSGITVTTNGANHAILHPTNVPPIGDGINAWRRQNPQGLFHRIGDVLGATNLSIASPLLGSDAVKNDLVKEEDVEAIPQRILSLLQLGEPRFVIWAYGQSLQPKDLYLGSGRNFQLCTNYQITGEVLTRTVCRVENVSTNNGGVQPKITVENFNIVPGE